MKSWFMVNSIRFFSFFPLALLRLFGRFLGYCLWWSNGRSRQITEFNLGLCFADWSPQQRRDLAKQSLRHLATQVLETGPMWFWQPQRLLSLIARVEGLPVLEQAEGANKGTLILAPHIGNWEMLGVFLGHRGKITILYQPQDDEAIDKLIYDARTRTGVTVVPTNTKGVKAMLKALKAGETVAILPDQIPSEGAGEFVDFYGEPVSTMTLVHSLLQRTGARAIAAIGEQQGLNRFQLRFLAVDEAIYEKDLLTSLSALNRSIERCVSLSPAQYQWEYNRFKYLPNGGRRSYKQPKKDS